MKIKHNVALNFDLIFIPLNQLFVMNRRTVAIMWRRHLYPLRFQLPLNRPQLKTIKMLKNRD